MHGDVTVRKPDIRRFSSEIANRQRSSAGFFS